MIDSLYLLKTILSWFSYMSKESILKENPKLQKLELLQRVCLDIDKFFTKYKVVKVSKKENQNLDKKFEEIRKEFELLVTDKDWSPEILTMIMLDYVMNELEDKELKKKFSHINTLAIISEAEKGEYRPMTSDMNRTVLRIINLIEE